MYADICLGYHTQMWCWIKSEWSPLRIYTYYLLIWICIVASAVIYIAVGYHVFHQRNQLKNLTLSHVREGMSTSDGRESASGEKVGLIYRPT